MTLAGRRYVVCRNRDEMKKDAAARAAILAALERQLKKGDKSLIGNKGYRRFLATPGENSEGWWSGLDAVQPPVCS